VEEKEDLYTLTAVFCFAIPYNPTACEPVLHKQTLYLMIWLRETTVNHGYVAFTLLWHLSNAFSASALEASLIPSSWVIW